MKVIRFSLALVAAAALGIVATPQPADACGGFFCSQQPVDQSAERIIFAQNGNEVRAWIQVAFNGNAEEFAWVIPVSSVPRDLDTTDSSLFQLIDTVTRPIIIPPTACQNFSLSGASDSDGIPNEGEPGGRVENGVIVYSEAEVGPYQTATVGSESPQMLIDWLNDNGYVITEAMVPMVAAYVEGDMLFFAMKLQPGEGVEALQPIVMTYDGQNPVIPLQLTAVAAEPNMGVLVWILGSSRAVPANYIAAPLDHDRLRFDQFVQSNYFALINQILDEHGGQAFITEFADMTENVPLVGDETLDGMLEQYDWVTRMYMTISPEEMTADPVFTFNAALPAVDRTIDLSDRDDLCDENTNPCDFNYCGPEGICHEVDGQATCECGDGFLARGVNDPVNGVGITCVPRDTDTLGEFGGDACSSVSCGEFGQCVSLNGVATCSCNSGFTATANSNLGTTPECIPLTITTSIVTTPSQSSTPGTVNSEPAGDDMACAAAPTKTSSDLLFIAMLLGGLVVLRRLR